LLSASAYTFTSIDWLLLMLGSGDSWAVQSAAIGVLARFNDPQIASALLRRCQVLAPPLRRDAVTALLSRANRVPEVLNALEDGRLNQADFPSAQKNFLRTQRDPAVSQRALQLFGPVPVQRPEAMRQFTPALRLQGDPSRGRELFQARCSGCHQLGGEGHALGPDLVAVRLGGQRKMLTAILEPNAATRPEYAAYVVETGTGDNLIGLLRDEHPTTITLGQPNGVALVLPRVNVRYRQAQSWSLMPDGLEEGLTPQGIADLLEYLMTAPR
jgi:putative heme-binding domain-containing protein